MSCTDCADCVGVLPLVPECFGSTNIDFGMVAGTGDYIIRVTKVSSGAITEQVVTVGGGLIVSGNLDGFDVDATFWQESAGQYKVELLEATIGTATQWEENGGSGDTADCLLMSFTPLDNITVGIIFTFDN